MKICELTLAGMVLTCEKPAPLQYVSIF